MIYTGGGHKQGVPLRMDNDMIYTGGGRPQGVPLRLDNDMIYTGGGRPQGVPLRDGYRHDLHGGEGMSLSNRRGTPCGRPPPV